MAAPQPRIRAIPRPVEELSVQQIEQIVAFGKRTASLIDGMEAAARAGDRERVWELVTDLVRYRDEIHKAAERRK